ncbi:AAA family ATPase [Rhizobium sp. GCM10022189]|uniref:AAA family ATPase n=1 Tax=Rhizobium sp. GCM10022189 TaxID=3252654 RepID=UPI003607EF94
MDFELYKRDARRPSLALKVAAIGLRRVLRPFLRHPEASFRALVVLDDWSAVDIYRQACNTLLEADNNYDPAGNRTVLVTKAFEINDQPSASMVAKLRPIRHAVIFCDKPEEISQHLRLVLDFDVSVPKPTAADFARAAERLSLPIKPGEAEQLAAFPLETVSLAARPGRPVARALKSLASMQDPDAEAKPQAQSKRGPNLETLAGYGEARDWGLQLAADILAYKQGKLEWADVDRGVLLHGPPGTGKTMFAQALANTVDIPLLLASAARWQSEGHLGDLLKAMRDVFDRANRLRPCIVFIDEFDSFGSRRFNVHSQHHDYKRHVINGLLECLDPSEGREGIIVIGATNDIDAIDPALLRPGRLEKTVAIELPDGDARIEILKHHLGDYETKTDFREYVFGSRGMTGADIAKVARDARRFARRRGSTVVLEEDILAAIPSRLPLTSDQRYRVAVHEAGHAIVGLTLDLGPLEMVAIASHLPREGEEVALGLTGFQPASAAFSTEADLTAKLTMCLAGLAAEKLVLGGHSVASGGGPGSDLVRATEIALMMERSFGFGTSLATEADNNTARQLHDETLDRAVEARLQASLNSALVILETGRSALDALALALTERLALTGEAVQEIISEASGKKAHEAKIGSGGGRS